MSKYLVIAGIAVLVVLIVAGAVFLVMRINAETTDVTVTVEGIKAIAQLATVEYTISEVVHVKLPKDWYEWENLEFLVMLTGKVTGNVDLDKVKVDIINEPDQRIVNLDFEKGAILIKNPQVGMNDLKIITIFDKNIFNKITDEHRNNAFNCAFSQLLRAAEEQGIREKTAKEAEVVLTRFLQGMGFEAKITFAEEDLKPINIDTSICDPSIFESLTR